MADHVQEHPLTSVLNALTEFVWLRDPSGRMEFMNEAARAALGVTMSDFEEDRLAYVRHILPEDRERVLSAGRAAMKRAVEVDFRVRLPGEEPRPMRARLFPLHNDYGETIAVMGIARDITPSVRRDQLRKELTRAEKARDQAKSNEDQMRAMLDRITDGFFALDQDWRVLYVNRRFQEHVGKSAAEVTGRSVFEVFPEFRGTIFHAQYERAMRESLTVEFEAFWEPLRAWYEVHVYPSPEGLSIFFHDVTEKHRLEIDLAESTARERQRVGAELHDSVGQKLTGASLLVRALEARASTGAPVDPADLGTVGKVLGDLIGEVRRISRGLFPLELEGHSLAAALDNLARDVEDLFGVSCETDLAEGIGFGSETEVHILRFAQELITNAVKHGEATDVRVELGCTPRGVELSIDHDGSAPAADRSDGYGLGLRSLEYRAQAIGAIIETEQVDDGRTRATCRIPS